MTQFTRIGSYLILFLGLLFGAVLMNAWLQQQTQAQIKQLNDDALVVKRAQFDQIAARLKLNARSPRQDLAEAGKAIGATAVPYAGTSVVPPGSLAFTENLGADMNVLVVMPAPPATRLLSVYHRVTLALLLLCPALFVAALLLASLVRRLRSDDRPTQVPWARERAQAVGMEHFAKISNERTVALAEEHDARLRAEEDLQTNRTLLDHSVGERVRLGRELHDNICQTLYAVCLTLESVQKKNTLAPELRQRVDQCMTELRRLNQEVRAYLQELEPARLNGQSFAGALAAMLQSFAAEDGVRIEQKLDAAAVELIAPLHIAEIMNILREAVSNSLRHGRARHITLLAGRSEEQIALAVQDDGAGFAPAAPRSSAGHGLGNMSARAAALGGSLRIESAPGKGTRVLLTLPVASPA